MALVFCDGFDDYTHSDNAALAAEMTSNGKWDTTSGTILRAYNNNVPYADGIGSSLRYDPWSAVCSSKPFTISGNKIILSFWHQVYVADHDGYIGTVMLRCASDDADVFGLHGDAHSYNLYWRFGSPSSTGENDRLSEVEMTHAYRVWSHFAIEVELATDATGSVRVFRDGVEVDAQTNVRTAGAIDAGGQYYIKLGFGSNFQASPEYNIDDLIVMDGSGSTMNSFKGKLRVLPLYANADISQSAGMTASSGGFFYADVDEQAINDSDATWVESPAVNDLALYGIEDLSTVWPAAATVEAVEILQRAAAGSAGSMNMRAVLDDGTNQVESADHTVSLTGPAMFWSYFETAPDGGSWSVAKVDALRIGHKKMT